MRTNPSDPIKILTNEVKEVIQNRHKTFRQSAEDIVKRVTKQCKNDVAPDQLLIAVNTVPNFLKSDIVTSIQVKLSTLENLKEVAFVGNDIVESRINLNYKFIMNQKTTLKHFIRTNAVLKINNP